MAGIRRNSTGRQTGKPDVGNASGQQDGKPNSSTASNPAGANDPEAPKVGPGNSEPSHDNELERLLKIALSHVHAVKNDRIRAKRLLQRLIASLELDLDSAVPNPYSPQRVATGFGVTNTKECLAKKIILDLDDAYRILQDYLTPGQGLSSSLSSFKRTFARQYEMVLRRKCEKLDAARNSKIIITYAELWHVYGLTAEDPMDELPGKLLADLGIDADDPLSA